MRLQSLVCFILFSLTSNAQVQLGPIVGAVTENSAVILVKTFSGQDVEIELFTQEELENSIFSQTVKALNENYNYVKIPVRNLKPNTTYYYRAIVDGFRSRRWHSFQTFPDNKNHSFSFGFGSCQQSPWNESKPEIFPVVAEDTLRFFIHLGDWTYPDTTLNKHGYYYSEKIELLEKSYQSRYNYNYPFVSEVLSQMPVAYVYDDHDFVSNNSDGESPYKENILWAYKTFFPHYELKNPDNGIWQSFTFGDVEFFLLDLRYQRNPNKNAFDSEGKFNPLRGHSMLSGYEIEGTNQKEWFLNALRNSTAKWKVIVSSVLFNPAYVQTLELDSLPGNIWWNPADASDKWAGFPEDVNALLNTIVANNIKNVFVISGDTHSAFIDDGQNSLLPEIGASNLDIDNEKLALNLSNIGINLWNKGGYDGDGHTYGRVRFFFGDPSLPEGRENYALLEIVDERGEIVVSHRLDAK